MNMIFVLWLSTTTGWIRIAEYEGWKGPSACNAWENISPYTKCITEQDI